MFICLPSAVEVLYVLEQLKFEKHTTNILKLRVQNISCKVVKSEKRKKNLFYSGQYEEYNMDRYIIPLCIMFIFLFGTDYINKLEFDNREFHTNSAKQTFFFFTILYDLLHSNTFAEFITKPLL